MAGAAALVEAAREAGAILRPRIWVERPDRLGPELRDALRRREAEVIRLLLAAEAAGDGDGVVAEDDPIAAVERAAIAAEPELAAPGTPERDRLDALHQASLVGHLRVAMRRPPSWSDPNAPSPGCFCSCCEGRRWWQEAMSPAGWRCATCHPWPRSWTADAVREVTT